MNGEHKDRFEIGGEDLLTSVQVDALTNGDGVQKGDAERWKREVFNDIRVRVGTLLKAETVSFLLGAGASVDCGGQLIGTVPLGVERDLLNQGISENGEVSKSLSLFYGAVQSVSKDSGSPMKPEQIAKQRKELFDEKNGTRPLNANFEQVLATLHRWRVALPRKGGKLRIDIDDLPSVDAPAGDLEEALQQATRALASACVLPAKGKESGLASHIALIRKVLTRPLNLKRVNIFTLNYDTLVEQAADAEGVVLLDGFVGTQRRIFRPESYEQDLYFPAETTEGRVHRFDRVLHLYKLHGSITWIADDPTIDNPYGVRSAALEADGSQPLLIYPTPAKYGETLGMPYSDLFRRFASALVRPQSVLFVIGYGFGDEHVNAIIRQALAVPSFTLVIVDPSPKSRFVTRLREQKDRRVWIAEGPTLGTFAGFVDQVLPDLRDEEIRKKVLATHRALANSSLDSGGTKDDD